MADDLYCQAIAIYDVYGMASHPEPAALIAEKEYERYHRRYADIGRYDGEGLIESEYPGKK